jgi:hypothetical protein
LSLGRVGVADSAHPTELLRAECVA